MRERGEVGMGARSNGGFAPDYEEGDHTQAAGNPPRHPGLGRAPENTKHAADCRPLLNCKDNGHPRTLHVSAWTGGQMRGYHDGLGQAHSREQTPDTIGLKVLR